MNPSTLSRRQFTTQIAIATAVGPTILGAERKSGRRPLIIGDGEHTYECVHDWGRDSLPAGHQYGWTSNGVAVDQQNRLYVSHHGTHGSVFVFDNQGKFIRSLVDQHRSKDEAAGHGIDIRSEGETEFLYLSPDDATMAFTKMTLDGEIVWQKDRQQLQQDSGLQLKRFRPTNSSFRPDGGYYLGDGYGSGYLFQYDRDDRFVRSLGGPGTTDGKFRTPHGQWLDDRDGTPKLVVCDRANQRLQWFGMDGKHLKSVGGFVKPADIDVRGELMVVADIAASITVLDKSDQVVARLGHDPEWEKRIMDRKQNIRGKRADWIPGRFVHPHDVCIDSDGNLFVSEYVVGGRVTKLQRV